MRSTTSRRRPRWHVATALGASLVLVLAACGTDDDSGDVPDPDQDLDVDPDLEDPAEEEPSEPDDAVDDPDDATEDPDDATEDPDDATEDPDDEATPEDDDADLLLDGEPSTETAEAEGEVGTLAVTEVRVGTHEGFDRVVFELEGDGIAGWHVRYEDEPTAQGSGEPIEFEGDAALAVAIHNVTLPPELPDGIEPVEPGTRVEGAGGLIAEVVSDTIFEGIHTFVVGTSSQQPFLIERFEDPQRVVIDLVHDG